MRDRKLIEDTIEAVRNGIDTQLPGGVHNASLILQALTLQVLLDCRDLLSQVENSTARKMIVVRENAGPSQAMKD